MEGKRLSRRALLKRAAAFAGFAVVGSLAAACGATPTPTKAPEPTKPAATQPPATKAAEPTKAAELTKAPTQPPVAATVPAKAETITLRVMTLGGVRGKKAYDFGATFMKANPNVTVKNEDNVFGEMSMKTELGFATGNLQDLLYCHTPWWRMGCYKGWYLPLDELIKAGLVPDYDDFYQTAVENEKWEGKTYGLNDHLVTGPGLFICFNRQLFKDAGVSTPEPSWNILKLQEAALKVANKEKGIFGIECQVTDPVRINNLLRCWGKPVYGVNGDVSSWITTPDGKKFRWTDNKVAEECYKNWFRPMLDARAHPNAADQVEGGLFAAGKVAMAQGSYVFPGRYEKATAATWKYDPKDYIVLPKGPEGRQGTCQETQLWAMYSKTKYPEESMRLIAHYTSTDAFLHEILNLESGYATRHSALSHPKVIERFPNYADADKIALSGNVEPYSMPWNLRGYEFQDTFINLAAPLYQGVKSWEEQAPIVQKECQKLFDQPRP